MKWYEKLAEFIEKRDLRRKPNQRPKHRIIPRVNPDGTVERYLERWYILRKDLIGAYLHRFWASDEDGVHDHPWDNISIVVAGGYWEHLPDGQRLWRKPGFVKFRKAEEFHRLEIPVGWEGKAWTIFIRFKRRRIWGFWGKDGWYPAEKQQGD